MRPADEPPQPAPRPLRSDAAANAERVLAAAIRTGLGEGRHVPLAEIAREAGVGVGTLYRRYPNRDALLEALEARAYGLLIGDGRLNYGTERAVEAYYALNLTKFLTLTFDYQFVDNPGYNRDRGPAHFFASRLHADF